MISNRLDNVVIVGSGGGGQAIAAELGLSGHPAVLADTPPFTANLDAIGPAGGIQVQWRSSPADTEAPSVFAPVRGVSIDPAAAVAGAALVIVCVPSYGHRPMAELLADAYQPGQHVYWVGEGGGAFAAVAARRETSRPDVVFAETNSLPYAGAFISKPGSLGATRKRGGTRIAALPATAIDEVATTAKAIWPWVTSAQNAWETVLLNFNAIDHVPAMICNLGPIEQPSGTYPIWGAGGTRGVVKVIEAVDGEYLALRSALGLTDATRYEQFLVEQGMAQTTGEDLYATIQSSILATVQFKCSTDALEHRFVAEDVPFALVLASSIGAEIGVATPVIDGLIAIAAAASGHDYRSNGRTLADWGLAGVGVDGLRRAVVDGWW